MNKLKIVFVVVVIVVVVIVVLVAVTGLSKGTFKEQARVRASCSRRTLVFKPGTSALRVKRPYH